MPVGVDVAAAEQQLGLVGMDGSQAAAYVRLAISGPMRAAELATALGISRQDAYRLIRSMTERGYVVSDLAHPASFSVVPAAEIFSRALASEAAHVRQLSKADEEVTLALAALRPEPPAAAPTFAIVRGRREILTMASALIASAQTELRLLSTHRATMNLADLSGIMTLVANKTREGVRVRALVQPDLIDDRLNEIVQLGVDVRAVDANVRGGIVIVDERAVMLSFVSDPSTRMTAEGDVSLRSDAPELTRLQSTLFDALWDGSEPVGVIPVRA